MSGIQERRLAILTDSTSMGIMEAVRIVHQLGNPLVARIGYRSSTMLGLAALRSDLEATHCWPATDLVVLFVAPPFDPADEGPMIREFEAWARAGTVIHVESPFEWPDLIYSAHPSPGEECLAHWNRLLWDGRFWDRRSSRVENRLSKTRMRRHSLWGPWIAWMTFIDSRNSMRKIKQVGDIADCLAALGAEHPLPARWMRRLRIPLRPGRART